MSVAQTHSTIASPTPRHDPLREAAIVGLALALCPLAAWITGDDALAARSHAQAVIDLERSLGLWIEPSVHAWTRGHATLLELANAFYLWIHVPATGAALIWSYLERPAAFGLVRRTFVIAQGLTVAGYLLFPVAPPRLLGHGGFTDELSRTWGGWAIQGAHSVQSAYAAMPSGHVVFALIAGGTMVALTRPVVVRLLGVAYPGLGVGVIVGTANHYVLDALAAVVVTLVALGLALALGRSARTGNPGAWRAVRRLAPQGA